MAAITEQGKDMECSVRDDQFPLPGKCYALSENCEKYWPVCPNCRISVMPPLGATLEVAVIFECERYDYCQRILQDEGGTS